MASWIVGERRPGSCSMSVSGQNNFQFKMSYSFIVATDDKFTSREEILFLTPGMPLIGRLYGPLGAKCVNVSCERSDESANTWFCEAEFETGSGNEQRDPAQNPNSPIPTDWIPTFKIDGFAGKEETITQDFSPNPKTLANSAGQLFDPPYTRTKTLPQFTAVQFEPESTSLDDIADRHDTVNSSSFSFGAGLGTFGARELLCHVKSAELGFYYTIRCWKVEYQLVYDRETFDIKIADFGTQYVDGTTNRPYMDKLKTFVINGPLNGSGARVLDGNGNPDADNAAILTFRIKRETDFSSFLRV